MPRIAWVRLLLFVGAMLLMGRSCAAQVAISVSFAPPELPVYEQPPCPGEDYIWTPGYWAWDNDGDDYYWVPGTWVLAPQPEYFWTPPYWAWWDGGYRFYAGYWGPVVGFYGGIIYGFGYYGQGYEGGRWEHGHFFYNRYVNNVNVTVIHNVYEERVENRYDREVRVSYNGHGGVDARPTAQEEAAARARHIDATPAQLQHFQAARQDRQLHASENRGRPPVAATVRPAEFNSREVVPARAGGNYTPPANRRNGPQPAGGAAGSRPAGNYSHAKELPPIERGAAPNTGNPKLDQKYQQQQQKMYDKQNQERQKLQQKQDQEHQKFEQQQANLARQQHAAQRQQQQQQMQQRQQQMEQQHQQQTQQMMQRHTQQQQQMQERQAPPPSHGGTPQHH